MTDRQAAEARERAEVISETERRIDGKLALTAIPNPDVMVPTRTLRALVHEAKQVDALSVRLAQAEQERDELLGWLRDEEDGYVRQRALRKEAEVRLREYEEALRQIDEESTHYDVAPGHLGYLARAVLSTASRET